MFFSVSDTAGHWALRYLSVTHDVIGHHVCSIKSQMKKVVKRLSETLR